MLYFCTFKCINKNVIMKRKMERLLCVPLLALALLVASCSEYEGPDLMSETPSSLVNTAWASISTDSIMVDTAGTGNPVKVDYLSESFVVFKTGEIGATREHVYSNDLQRDMDTIVPFTYKYQNPDGVISIEVEGSGFEGNTKDFPFRVNGKKLILEGVEYQRWVE